MEQSKELIRGQGELGAISDINVTPFIDVMLVLLIIFMVTAPLMMGGVKVNLPKTSGTPMPRPENPLIVSLDSESRIFVDREELTESDRMAAFRRLALESESGEVYVRGDGEVKYARMMELMADLGQAGFSRVSLVTSVQDGGLPAQPGAAAVPAEPARTPGPPAGSPAPEGSQASPAPGGPATLPGAAP
jgi:biopolymer transport protein ExbD